MPQLKPLYVKWFGDGISTNRSNPYVNSYANPQSVNPAGFHKMGGVRTMVSGSHPGFRSRSEVEEGRNSSEVELKGIEVQTTINHEFSANAPGRADRDDRSSDNGPSYTAA